MASDHRFGSINLCGMRITRLTSGGAPVPGAGNGYISTAPIKLDNTINTEKGDSATLKNGCGQICQTYTNPDTIDSITLGLDLCQNDPEILEMMTGGLLIPGSGGHPRGVKAPRVGASPNPVCLEVWTQSWDGSVQATSPLVAAPTFMHYVFPSVKWTLGNTSIAAGILTIPLTGTGAENPHITANGPYDDWPTDVAAVGGIDTLYGWFYDAGPPPVGSDGYISVTSAAS